MSLTLFKRELKANWVLTAIFLGVMAMYSCVMVAMFDPKLGESLELMANSMPEIFAAFSMTNAATNLVDFLANYLYGFLFIAFPLVYIILLSSRLVSRYVDRGSMAYLLATPHKRIKIIFTQAVTSFFWIFVLDAFTSAFLVVVSQAMFPNELNIKAFLVINIGMLCVHLFLLGVNFLSSCIFNESKTATGVGGGICIAFVLVQMVSQVGDKMANLKYLNPLTLFNIPDLITYQNAAFIGIAVLAALGILMYGIGIIVFTKKDMPV